MKPNSHKYILKSQDADTYKADQSDSVNVSRSIGSSGNWIGCGCIDKSGTEIDHRNIHFPFFSLVYVIQGIGTYIDEHHTHHTLKNGCLFQRRPGLIHSTLIDPNSRWKEYYIDFNTEYYHHLCDIGLIEKEVSVYQLKPDPSLATEYETLMQQLNHSNERKLPDILLNFLTFIRNLINQGNLRTENQDSRDMMEKACLDFSRLFKKRIDLKEYCRRNGWGYESFRKDFKNRIGISPGKYMVQRRLDQACRLLRSTEMRISEISENLGYKSQYEFSNQFKKQFGVFPKHFRNGAGKEKYNLNV